MPCFTPISVTIRKLFRKIYGAYDLITFLSPSPLPAVAGKDAMGW